MNYIYAVEKQIYVHGDDIDPGSLTAWTLDKAYWSKRSADKYAERRNENPCSLRRRVIRKHVT
ncbi:MAG: hypothetical protein OQK12_09885 [Motiliproteus sp.]|nr:hypothetical protein [Motiliproteus sp.]MCW9051269.1 hypothetical protein [Motiliproteus sp.]